MKNSIRVSDLILACLLWIQKIDGMIRNLKHETEASKGRALEFVHVTSIYVRYCTLDPISQGFPVAFHFRARVGPVYYNIWLGRCHSAWKRSVEIKFFFIPSYIFFFMWTFISFSGICRTEFFFLHFYGRFVWYCVRTDLWFWSWDYIFPSINFKIRE